MTQIITGYYGSGKTEFVVNLAVAQVSSGAAKSVTIADLDIINPFFRSRERASTLAPMGISVQGSVYENHVAQDLPALSYGFLSNIRRGESVIIDLPGGEGGLRLLSPCYDAIELENYEFLCVFNMYRPETDTAEKMLEFCRKVNEISQIPITGIVNNGNMLHHTVASHVLDSQRLILDVCERLGLPLKYTHLREDIYSQISEKIVSEKVVLFNKLQMRADWL